jgi:hypothetical protein
MLTSSIAMVYDPSWAWESGRIGSASSCKLKH